MNDAFKYSSNESFSLDEAAMDWMISFNFRSDNEMGYDPSQDFELQEFQYQHRGFAKYVELAKLLGWKAIYNMNNIFYTEWTANGKNDDIIDKDRMLRAASEGNNINIAPLFHFWGHGPSPSLEADLQSLPIDPAIYNQLAAYYQLVPATQADFLPYRDRLLERKDPVHYDRINAAYNNYETENYAQQMRDQICDIITKYYPHNPPCDDITSSVNLTIDDECIVLHPNPMDGIFTLVGDFQNYTIQIVSQNGTVHQNLQGQSSPINIDISSLPSGLYFIRAFNNNNANLTIQKLNKL